jgi:hypothetical protein
LRKAAKMVTITIIINDEGNNRWTYKTRSTFRNLDEEFKIDEEIDEGLRLKFKIKLKFINQILN